MAKKRHGRPPKVPAYRPREVLRQRQEILEADQHLDEVEEVDQLLADQQKMHSSAWERAQVADPVISL